MDYSWSSRVKEIQPTQNLSTPVNKDFFFHHFKPLNIATKERNIVSYFDTLRLPTLLVTLQQQIALTFHIKPKMINFVVQEFSEKN